MLIETQVVRSKSELLKELQGLPVTKAVIYRNVDRKAWKQMVRTHSGVRVAVRVKLVVASSSRGLPIFVS
jgi:hypothetical protein